MNRTYTRAVVNSNSCIEEQRSGSEDEESLFGHGGRDPWSDPIGHPSGQNRPRPSPARKYKRTSRTSFLAQNGKREAEKDVPRS